MLAQPARLSAEPFPSTLVFWFIKIGSHCVAWLVLNLNALASAA